MALTKETKSEIVKKQLNNKDINIFNNKKFDSKDNSSNLDFNDLINVEYEINEKEKLVYINIKVRCRVQKLVSPN